MTTADLSASGVRTPLSLAECEAFEKALGASVSTVDPGFMDMACHHDVALMADQSERIEADHAD